MDGLTHTDPSLPQTLQMGIYHFSGLFVLLCLGLGCSLLTSLGEHIFYRLVLPRIRKHAKLQYWLHTSQKIHRALNTSLEQQKNQKAEPEPAPEPSCNPPGQQSSRNSLRPAVKGERRVRFQEPGMEGPDLQLTNGRLPQQQPVGQPEAVRPQSPPLAAAAAAPATTTTTTQSELKALEQRIEGMREQLRAALLRKSELVLLLGRDLPPRSRLLLPPQEISEDS